MSPRVTEGETKHQEVDLEAPPPIGGSWKRLYVAVLLNLALLVAIFYAFTKAFA